jgi:hypothetical protein
MWQLTWILSFLPDWFWTLLFFASISSIGLSYILKPYKLPLQIGGAIALIISIWFLGAASNEEKWQVRVKELEAKLAIADEKSKEENVKIEEKIITKTKVIKQKGEEIIKYIDRNNEITKFVEICPLPKEAIEIHNAAAQMNKAATGDKK